jgi:type I restriction enzyme S subunit
MRAAARAIPEGWSVRPLRELLREVDVRVADLPAEERHDLEVLSLTKRFGLIPQSERFEARVATDDVTNYKIVRRGWIVYNPYVIWEGAIHALQRTTVGVVSPVYAVWERIEDDGGFLDLALRTPELLACYERLGAGAVNRRRSIKKEAFLAIEVAVPPLDEQRQIAKALRLVLRAIAVTEKLLATTRELKQSAMRQLFTRGLRGEPQKETEIGPVPESWSVVPLGQCLTAAQYGLSVRGEETGRYPILRMNCQVNGQVVFRNLQFVDLDDKTFAAFRVNDGDLLFNRTNSYELVGRTAVFRHTRDAVFASYLIRLTLDPRKFQPEFLNYYINQPHVQAALKALASRGVSQANISASKLKEFRVPKPHLAEQHDIAALLQTIDRKITVHERKRATLQELFKTLLHQLMTGQIRVDNLDIDTSEVAAA